MWQIKSSQMPPLPESSMSIAIEEQNQQDVTVTIKERAHLLRQLFTNTLSQTAVVQFFEFRKYGLIPFPSYENVQARAQLHINFVCTKHDTRTDIPWQLYTY